MILLEVLVSELLAVYGLAAGALGVRQLQNRNTKHFAKYTLPRVKSPPCNMKSGMTRWNFEPL